MMHQPAVVAADDGGDEGILADTFDRNRDVGFPDVGVVEEALQIAVPGTIAPETELMPEFPTSCGRILCTMIPVC